MLSIVDATATSIAAIQDFCRERAVQGALLNEYASVLHEAPHLREYFYCVLEDDEVVGVCWVGGNIVPLAIPTAAVRPLARRILSTRKRFASVVGDSHLVGHLWEALRESMPRPRSIRPRQPLMTLPGPPAVEADPLVRPTRWRDFGVIYPACVQMFTEEVGYSPEENSAGYEVRVASLVREKRSLSRIEDHEVIFKAELGVVAYGVAQLQGVWINPTRRGENLAPAGVAAVATYARKRFEAIPSLYVNDFNHAAIHTYERVGFEQVGEFATVMF